MERNTNHPGCRLERALLRQADGEFQGAVDDLRVVYEADSDPATAARLVEALRRAGDYAAIGPVLDRALEDAPNSGDLLFALARLQLRDRNDAAAEQTLRRVVGLDPTSADALRLLGGVLQRTGQEAEGSYRLGQADLYRDYHAAIRALTEGYADNPHATGALMIAEVELTVGNYEAAQRWLETARAGGAPEHRTAAALAWTWYALGDLARGDAELARSGGEDDGHANLARAARAARMNELEPAGNWLRRALESGPNERNFLHRAADLYRSIGDPVSAEQLRHRAATAEFP